MSLGNDTPVIVFLSDFGTLDDYVGQMHAVALRLNRRVQRVDLCHEVAPGDVAAGAFLLLNDFEVLPDRAVVAAVVDPGVGTERKLLALPCRGERWLVGPDNGLLEPAFKRYGDGAGFEIVTVPGAERTSKTFHGRDVITPAAMHLLSGGTAEELGSEVESGNLITVDLDPVLNDDGYLAEIYWVDRFGSLVTNFMPAQIEELEVLGPEGELTYAPTFASLDEGEIGWTVGSRGTVEIIVNNGSASMLSGLGRGDRVLIKGAMR